MYTFRSVTETLQFHRTALDKKELMQDYASKMILAIVHRQLINFLILILQLSYVLIHPKTKTYKCG